MTRTFFFCVVALLSTGCQPAQPPQLSSKLELRPNLGEIVRVEGTARYLKISGPTIAADGFEIRVYPRTLWGPELDGQKIQVIGRLNDSSHATPPDPSLNPGEYWLGDSTWKPAVPEKK